MNAIHPEHIPGRKLVYSYDPTTGLFVGTTEADECSIQPGVFHLPAFSTETPPPKAPEGHVTKWGGASWGFVPVAEVPAEETTPAPGEPDPVEAEIKAASALVQRVLDAVAQSRGYESILAAISYAEEPAVPSFQAEGRVFRRWRSLVWQAAFEQFVGLRAGATFPASPQAFVDLLPSYADAALAESTNQQGAQP